MKPVSYTHLDVYKRQIQMNYINMLDLFLVCFHNTQIFPQGPTYILPRGNLLIWRRSEYISQTVTSLLHTAYRAMINFITIYNHRVLVWFHNF